ncbi:MAG TPA: Rieske 2Fe-2S domain-containing protein [Longimicrobiales bacterium]
MGDYHTVLRTQELGPGQMRAVEVDGRQLLVANVGQTYYALSARCPNDGVDLARDGRMRGDLLICPGDDWAFDIRTGERVRPRRGPGLRRYAVGVRENRIEVGPELVE